MLLEEEDSSVSRSRQKRSLTEYQKIGREYIFRSTPGLISEADILYREYPDEDMLFATEMFYSVNDSPRYNFTLLLRYIKALFRGRIG